MTSPQQTMIACSNCGQQIPAAVLSVIDLEAFPQGKSLLLTGRLNTAQCPNCGATNVVNIPLIYHDPSKELLVAYMPLELGMQQNEQEKVIGELLQQLPKRDFKGYMFNPKRTMSLEGLHNLILEADGVTPEMMEQQRERVRLAQSFFDTKSEQELESLVKQHDDDIDLQFFQALSVLGQRIMQEGRQEEAEAVAQLQAYIAANSTYGQEMIRQQQIQQQAVQEVGQRIEALGNDATRQDFMQLAFEFAEDDNYVQALVGLVRPAFDYEFFQMLTTEIGKAPAEERPHIEALRDRILELTSAIDEQQQMMAQNATAFLQAVVQSDDPEAMLRSNAPLLDEVFMSVLSANIKSASERADIQTSARLKQIYEMAARIIQERLGPELQFINQLLSAEDDNAAEAILREYANEYGEDILDILDEAEALFTAQGNDALVNRLQTLTQRATAILND